jgi:signal transduction histidine kinase
MTKVLLVEDNLNLLENIALELELRDYKVMQAGNGEIALQLMQTTDAIPDIIVSDIAMPKMDGYKLLEAVQSNDDWASIPFIFLTAFDSRNAVYIGKEMGADDYLVKPFQPDELVIAIENKLKRIARFKRKAEAQMDHARRELLHLISHELRTPLTSIFGSAEMLTESVAEIPDETAAVLLNLIQSGARRMSRLVNNVLFLIQIDSGHLHRMIDESGRPYDLRDIVVDGCRAFQTNWEMDDPAVDIQFDNSDTPIYVRGIREFLVTAVAEVMRNAVMFAPSRSRIDVNIGPDGDEAIIAITDRGPGIADADLPYIWDRFVQSGREEYEQQGVGLGLAVVRATIEAHGGSAGIESGAGSGTTVTMRLPLVAVDAASESAGEALAGEPA